MSIEQTGFTNYFGEMKCAGWKLKTAESISNFKQESGLKSHTEHYFSASPLASNLHKVFGNRSFRTSESGYEINIDDLPDPYKNARMNQAASDGSAAGKRAYMLYRENGREEDNQSLEVDNPQEYWKNYWKSYYRDYYKQFEIKESAQPDENQSQGNEIFTKAESHLGEKVWRDSQHERHLQNGRLGSATSVAKILNSLGYDYATSPGVAKLAQQLIARGWKPVSLKELRPGDVIYGGKNADWQKGGGNAHMAIVGQKGYVLHNNSETGIFTAEKVGDVYDAATYGNRIWALRPPENGPENNTEIPVRRDSAPEGSRTRSLTETIGQGAREIVNAAVNSVGKAMFLPMLSWAMGRLGCAASVSGVLKEAGYNYAHHAGVFGLSQQLIKNGWQKLDISQAQPGDVVVGIRRSNWKNGGGGSHIGIIGDGNKSYHNSSARKQWFESTLSYWNTRRYPKGVFILRPPVRNA